MKNRIRYSAPNLFQIIVIGLVGVLLVFGGSTLYRLLKPIDTSPARPVSISAWGDNHFGQIGDGHVLAGDSIILPKHLELDTIRSLDAGLNHSLALTEDGRVLSWGDNAHGQLGTGKVGGVRPSPREIKGLRDITLVAAGQDHSLALDTHGRVWTWGLNMSGQLGDGSNNDRGQPRVVLGLNGVTYIAAGYRSSLAIKQDGSVWAWGGNCNLKNRTKNLQSIVATLKLGTYGIGGGTVDQITPEDDCLYEDYLNVKSYRPIHIKGLPPIDKIDIGWGHALALTKSGELWVWGCNMYGQLGAGKDVTTPAIHRPIRLTGLGRIVEVSAGYRHSLALTDDGKLWAWGHNYFGELGLGGQQQLVRSPEQVTALGDISHIYAGHDYSLMLKKNGELWGVGQGASGQLSRSSTHEDALVRVTSEHFSSVAAGGAHVLAITKK